MARTRTPSAKYQGSPSNREQSITWTHELRVALHILRNEYPESGPIRVAIFNNLFKAHLTACRATDGATSRKLDAQWAERKKPTNQAWVVVLQGAKSPDQAALRRKLSNQIRDVATSLGVAPAAVPTPEPTHITTRQRSISHVEIDVAGQPEAIRLTTVPITPSTSSRKKKIVSVTPITVRTFGVGISTLATPPTTPRKSRRETAIILYERPSGDALYLKPKEFAEVQADLVPITQEAAHPPMSPLLFRSVSRMLSYQTHSAKFNADTGMSTAK